MNRFDNLRLLVKTWSIFNIFLGCYGLLYIDYDQYIIGEPLLYGSRWIYKLWFLMALNGFKTYCMINSDVKYIYIMIWVKMWLVPIILLYGYLFLGILNIYHMLYIGVDYGIGLLLTITDIGADPVKNSFIVPLYYYSLEREISCYNKVVIKKAVCYILCGITLLFGMDYLPIWMVFNNMEYNLVLATYIIIYGLYTFVIGIENDNKWLLESYIIEKMILIPLYISYFSQQYYPILYLLELIIAWCLGWYMLNEYGRIGRYEYIKWLYLGTKNKITIE